MHTKRNAILVLILGTAGASLIIFTNYIGVGILLAILAVTILSGALFRLKPRQTGKPAEAPGRYFYLCDEAFIGEIVEDDTLIIYRDGRPIVSATLEELRKEIEEAAKDFMYPFTYRRLWKESLQLLEANLNGELP
jgi:hypothetical protein